MLLEGHIVQLRPDTIGPGHDVLHKDALLGQRRLLTSVVLQFGAELLQPFGVELALMVELVLGYLAPHVHPDGPVLLGLHTVNLALGHSGLLFPAVICLNVHGRHARHD